MKKSSALGLGLVGLVGLAGVVACGGSSEILSGDLGGALASSNDVLRDGGAVAPPIGTPTSPPPRDAGPQSLRDAAPASAFDLTGPWRAWSEDPISVELEQGGVVLGGRACGVMRTFTDLGRSLLEPGNPNCTTFMDGRVEGRRVQFRFTLSYPDSGTSPIDYRVDALISADGRSFDGDLEEYDHGTKRVTVHKVNWTREMPAGTPTSPPPRDGGAQSLRDAAPASIYFDLTGRWRASSEDPISVELEQGGVVLGGRVCGVMMVAILGRSPLEPGNPNCTTFMDGRVEGRRVQFRFTLSYPFPGLSPIDYRVDALISDDKRSFVGDLEEYDHGTKRVTVHKVSWTRE